MGIGGKRSSKVEEGGEVVGVEGSLGSPLKIGGYLGGGYGEVRGGWVTIGGESRRAV